jgi:hypothetical protein
MSTNKPYDCESGWHPLISRTIEKLNKLGYVKIQQIKEKFGGLRIYVSVLNFDEINQISPENNKLVNEIITQAEREAMHTCEVCGLNDAHDVKIRDASVIKTMCTKCAVERKITKGIENHNERTELG